MPFGMHTLLLSLEGGLWAFGDNNDGQLGLGHKEDQKQPVEVPWNGSKPVQVDWGSRHSLVLEAEGGVWEAGLSRSSSPSLTFQRVPGIPCIAQVAAGESHSAAIDTEGGLWVWTSETLLPWASSSPRRVEDLPVLVKVACGFRFFVAEAEDGSLCALGFSECLGLNHSSAMPLVQMQQRSRGPLRCLAALRGGVILIDSQGAVFSVGQKPHDCSYGQLGRPITRKGALELQRISDIPPMREISCGNDHSLCLDEKGGVWTWGRGGSGQLGRGNTGHQFQPALVPSLQGMSAVVAGSAHSLVFPENGGLMVFGRNIFGQLGLNHKTDQSTPTLSPLQPACPHSATRTNKKSARF